MAGKVTILWVVAVTRQVMILSVESSGPDYELTRRCGDSYELEDAAIAGDVFGCSESAAKSEPNACAVKQSRNCGANNYATVAA